MKHLLKINALALMFIALAVLIIDLQSSSEQSGLVSTAAGFAMMTGVALLEIDRRLLALESDKKTSDAA